MNIGVRGRLSLLAFATCAVASGAAAWFGARLTIGPALLVVIGSSALAAALLGTVAVRLFARPLRDLLRRAQVLADHDRPRGPLESSLRRLGDELEGVVQALAGERDRIEAVLEGMTEAVFAVDAEGRVTLVNTAASRLLAEGVDPLGAPLAEVMPSLAPMGPTHDGSNEVTLPGPRHVLVRSTPQRSGEGRVIVVLDITRQRRLEQVRRDFVANVSHELRTPVSVIRANAETLQSGALDDPEQARGFVEALSRNAERLSNLIDDLLDIARIEAGRYRVEPKDVAVIEPAIVAFEQVERLALDSGTALDVDLAEGLRAVADDKALSHVLTNLMENAVKYTQPGGAVRLVGRRRDGAVRLEVRDDGPGISAEHRERIFERFYRVDRGRSTEAGGTGLGLAIVKHLVGVMGGRLGVEANAPRGSIFWVELPRPASVEELDQAKPHP